MATTNITPLATRELSNDELDAELATELPIREEMSGFHHFFRHHEFHHDYCYSPCYYYEPSYCYEPSFEQVTTITQVTQVIG